MSVEELAEVVQALTGLAWPILVAVVLWRSRRQIREIIETAKTRRFTVKVAGTELTMEEAADQQRKLVSALQSQILDLQAASGGNEAVSFDLSGAGEAPVLPSRVLWVDDHPRNNATLVAYLEDLGITVDIARSTAEGLAKLADREYGRIITDLGRSEQDGFVEDAGLRLVREVRSRDADTPIIVYTSRKAMVLLGEAAIEAGASEVTDSPGKLLTALDLGSLDLGSLEPA